MSDTPRTDALAEEFEKDSDLPTGKYTLHQMYEILWAHARTLERELATRPEAVECLRDILDCPQEDDPNGYVQYTVPAELVKKAIASLAPQPSGS